MMTDYSFQILFETLQLIGTPMHWASETQLQLLDRVFDRVRQRMVESLRLEVTK